MDGLYDYGARFYDSSIMLFNQPDTLISDPYNPLDWNRYSYARNNPLKYIDPDGHNPLLIIALIGAAIFFSQVPSDQVQTDPARQGDGAVMAFGAALMVAPALGPALCLNNGDCTDEVNAVTSAGPELGKIGAAVNDPSDEVKAATSLANQAIEATTSLAKIESQLVSKADLLGIQRMGNMSSMNNPEVQKGLALLNNTKSGATEVWSGTWKGVQVIEYIKNGVGVVVNQKTGGLITVLERKSLAELQAFVDNGTARWLMQNGEWLE